MKTIVIVGPTASGKSDLAILLARKYNGEIISADSRQVYRGMDIGTGKVTKAEQKIAPHHLIDVASPRRSYNISHFIRDAKKVMADVRKRGRVPIICGGTHFWIQALITGDILPPVKPNLELRKKLDKLSTEKLFSLLVKKDSKRAKDIDKHNKVRLIRALEICATLGTVPKTISRKQLTKNASEYIIISTDPDIETLRKNIHLRLKKRFRKGMIAEVKHLHDEGVSFKKLESFGLEYRYIALFLQDKLSRSQMETELETEIWHYAKRQYTFIRRMEKSGLQIHRISDPKDMLVFMQKNYVTDYVT